MEAHVLEFILHEHKGRRLCKYKWDRKQRSEWGQGGAAGTGLSRGGGPLHSKSAPKLYCHLLRFLWLQLCTNSKNCLNDHQSKQRKTHLILI